MRIVTGVDIVHIGRFRRSASDDSFLRRCFHATELEDSRVEHLAGIFAAKESVIKALSFKPGSWLDVKIAKDAEGNPRVEFLTSKKLVESSDVSIAHDGEYAVASFVAIV